MEKLKIDSNESFDSRKIKLDIDGTTNVISLSNMEYKFKSDSISNFLKFLDYTEKILSIYYANDNKGNSFYLSEKSYGNKKYTDLVLDDGLIFDTNYLKSETLDKFFESDEEKKDYVNFLNRLVSSNIQPEDINNLKQDLVNIYVDFANKYYKKYSLIFKNILKENDSTSFYNDLSLILHNTDGKFHINMLKGFYKELKDSDVSKDIIYSIVFLNSLLDNYYKIKHKYDLIKIDSDLNFKRYADLNTLELNYFKSLFPKDIKVHFYNSRLDFIPDKLYFKLYKNSVKIYTNKSREGKIEIGEIIMPSYYLNIIKKIRT